VVALCVLAAAAVRTGLLRLDPRLAAQPLVSVSRAALATASAVAVVVLAATFVAVGGPGYVSRQFDTFVDRPEPKGDSGDLRQRLTDPSSNGRIDEWRVSADAFADERLHGTGAGTFQIRWNRDRPDASIAYDGHSLYMETLGELGIVGLLLVVAAIAAILVGAAVRIRGPDRALHAVACMVLALWALRAGIDWDWEMPVVTLAALCVGGAAIAVPARASEDDRPPTGWRPPPLARLVAGLGCLFLAITPYQVLQSQRHLDAAVVAFDRDDCPRAVDQALSSLEAVAARPQPRVVLAYCDLRLGRPDLALKQIDAGLERDPRNWELVYAKGIVRARLGMDPRPQMREALRLNPHDDVTIDGVKLFATGDPRLWARRAERVPLPGV
jgi:O-Antigen ligase